MSNKMNCSKSNGTMFEQIGLAFVAIAGQPYFANNGYIATSDEDIERWIENDYLFFTRYLHELNGGFQRGWGIQGKIHIGDLKIEPDFYAMESGSVYEFKCQASSGSIIEKLYKNFLTYQALEDPSYIVYHGKGFDKRFFNSIDSHRSYLKNPDITQFISFKEFVSNNIGILDDFSAYRVSVATDKEATKETRKKHPKLKNYIERVLYDIDSKKVLKRFKTLQLLEDAKSDGFKDDGFFKKRNFDFA